MYPIVFLDGMYCKVRDNGKVVTKVLYNILGINSQGLKEILGFYIADSEGANFWLLNLGVETVFEHSLLPNQDTPKLTHRLLTLVNDKFIEFFIKI